jgi:hypothetical protein
MYTSVADCDFMHVQYRRFDDDSALHPLLRTVPHVAFKVSDLNRAIAGRALLLGPYEPIEGFRVAIVRNGEQPVELIETMLTDEQIWGRARRGEQASIYPEGAD